MQSFVNEYVALGKQADEKGDEVYDAFSEFMKVDKEVLELSMNGFRMMSCAWKRKSTTN